MSDVHDRNANELSKPLPRFTARSVLDLLPHLRELQQRRAAAQRASERDRDSRRSATPGEAS